MSVDVADKEYLSILLKLLDHLDHLYDMGPYHLGVVDRGMEFLIRLNPLAVEVDAG